MNSYVAKKEYEQRTGDRIESFTKLEQTLGDTLPIYNFSFTGPNPQINFTTPDYTRVNALMKDGFIFTPSVSIPKGYQRLSPEAASQLVSYCPDHLTETGFDSFRISNSGGTVYGVSFYFFTEDGQLYFFPVGYSGSGYNGYLITYTLSGSCYFDDVAGNRIYDYNGSNEIRDSIVSVGVCLNMGNLIASAVPVNVANDLQESDFTTTTGGEAISQDIPRTETENVIGGAISAGLISADAPLTIGEDGTITRADDIPIEKLAEILDAITSGNLKFESIEEYLSLISTLVANGNLTTEEQRRILENLNTLTGAAAKSITEIKDILKEWAEAAEAEAAAENLDFDLPDVTIIDKFPFSLPFDVYYVLNLFCTEPKEPVFTIPIKTTINVGDVAQEIDESFTLDLTSFRIGGVDMVRTLINTAVTISFVFFLISSTRKFIWK